VAYLLVLVFTLAAAGDFFIPGLHRNLVAYALAHAPTVPLLLVFVWWAHPNASWEPLLGCLLAIAGGAALAIEVARKTFAPAEERAYVETYSAVIGPGSALLLAAVALAIGWAGAAAYAVLVGAPSNLSVGALVAGAGVVVWAGTVQARTHVRIWRSAAIAMALLLLGWPAAIELGKVVMS
jgi:hypothetical protein